MSDPSTDIAKVLVSEEEIRRRVSELAAEVEADFAGRDLVVVLVLPSVPRDRLSVPDIRQVPRQLRRGQRRPNAKRDWC